MADGRDAHMPARGPRQLPGSHELQRRARVVEATMVAGGAAFAAGVPRVAGAAGPRPDAIEEGILLTVDADLDQVEDVARRLPLAPQLVARRRPQHRPTGGERFPERELVGVAHKQHLAVVGTLQHHGEYVLA